MNVSKYHPKPGVLINEEEIKAGKEKATAVFKAAEALSLGQPRGLRLKAFNCIIVCV